MASSLDIPVSHLKPCTGLGTCLPEVLNAASVSLPTCTFHRKRSPFPNKATFVTNQERKQTVHLATSNHFQGQTAKLSNALINTYYGKYYFRKRFPFQRLAILLNIPCLSFGVEAGVERAL